MKPEEKITHHYTPRLEKYRETHKILDWESREAQYARFEILWSHVELEGKSLLDVGCGCGDLLQLLKEKGTKTEYTGVDILPGMIEKAQSLHDGGRFICADLFGGEGLCGETFDVVFTSGIFNLNLGNNAAFFDAALPVLADHAAETVVINLLHEDSPDRDEAYFYFNPRQVLEKMENLGLSVRLIDNYLDNDFTVIGEKKS